ncbi:MAG: hypothetical protein ACTS8S_05335 [Giesbergeria sp.]
MVLEYLDFDLSEDGDGGASWDAMACVLPARLAAALREAQAVLAWAHTEFGAPGEWSDWDCDLQCHQDGVGDLGAAFDGETGALRYQPYAMDGGRCTLTLTLSGTPAFGAALRERFSID